MPAKYLDEVLTRAPGAWIQATDPAADNPTWMAVNVLWIDTTATPPTLKKRNATNDGWDTLGKIRTDAQFNEDVDDRVGALVIDSTSIDATYDDGAGSLSLAVKDEWVEDKIGAKVVAGTGISVAYNDTTGETTVTNSDPGSSGGLTTEQVQDIVGAMIVGGTDIDANYDDGAGTVTIDSTAAGGGGDFDFERFFEIVAPPNGTTRLNLGIGALSITTPGTGPTSSDDNDGPWSAWTTGASSGNEINAGPATFSFCRKEWGGAYIFRVKTGASIADVRIWIGLSGADPASTATPDVNGMMFRYSTNVDGTAFWRTYTDNTGASPEVQTTGLAIATDTAYTFKIVPSASEIKFYHWNGTTWDLLTTHTTLPTGSMGPVFVCKTLAASDKTFKFSFFRGRHK